MANKATLVFNNNSDKLLVKRMKGPRIKRRKYGEIVGESRGQVGLGKKEIH